MDDSREGSGGGAAGRGVGAGAAELSPPSTKLRPLRHALFVCAISQTHPLPGFTPRHHPPPITMRLALAFVASLALVAVCTGEW